MKKIISFVIFTVTMLNAQLTVLHSFEGNLYSGVIKIGSTPYGMTYGDGTSSMGTIF